MRRLFILFLAVVSIAAVSAVAFYPFSEQPEPERDRYVPEGATAIEQFIAMNDAAGAEPGSSFEVVNGTGTPILSGVVNADGSYTFDEQPAGQIIILPAVLAFCSQFEEDQEMLDNLLYGLCYREEYQYVWGSGEVIGSMLVGVCEDTSPGGFGSPSYVWSSCIPEM